MFLYLKFKIFNKTNIFLLDLPNPNDLNQGKRPKQIFACQALFMILSLVYGMFGLPYEQEWSFLDLSTIQDNPHIMIHRMVPKAIWPQIDFCFITGAFTAVLMFIIYAIQPFVDDRFRMYCRDDDAIVYIDSKGNYYYKCQKLFDASNYYTFCLT